MSERDAFDEWYADALTFTPGEVVRGQDAFDAFRATLAPAQVPLWPFGRVSSKLRGLTGKLDPRGPILIANVAWTKKLLEIGDDLIMREVD